jgi:hypothetical protein
VGRVGDGVFAWAEAELRSVRGYSFRQLESVWVKDLLIYIPMRNMTAVEELIQELQNIRRAISWKNVCIQYWHPIKGKATC